MAQIVSSLLRLLRHRWHEGLLRPQLPPAALAHLGAQITQSEQLHTGEVRICVEAGLPWSYLRRQASARDRALSLFGKLRIWDTEHNNGVLIYLLLAEHAIEIVADRGLARQVPEATWQQLVVQLRTALQAGQFETGLQQTLDAVSTLLVQHFPAQPQSPSTNELADAVIDSRDPLLRL